MSKSSRATLYFRIGALAAGLLLPALALIPFGSLWLWQHGYILHWAIASLVFVGVAFEVQRRFLQTVTPSETSDIAHDAGEGEAAWTPLENAAWKDVQGIASAVNVEKLNSREAIVDLGVETVRAVAKRLHPEVSEPHWRFTVPEAFAIIEQVSRRLRHFASENIPLSDRLTVSHAMALYRWRGALGHFEKAYDIWRLIRLSNPLTAATQELRDRVSKQMLQWGQAHVTQRLTHAYVSEVGRAAIDLYGGRLRVTRSQQVQRSADAQSTAGTKNISAHETDPLRILIAGQIGAGKSSLVNALACEIEAEVNALPTTARFHTYELRRAGMPGAQLIDSPGLGPSDVELESLLEKAMDCDLILWIVPAHRADREIDRNAIVRLRQGYLALPNRRPPPLLVVLSHIDKLRPLLEWAPPYDLNSTRQPKAVSIRAAMAEVSRELDTESTDIVPVSLMPTASYNLDALWARVLMSLPDASSAQLTRQIQNSRLNWNWQRIWSQAVGGGRVLAKTLGGHRDR